MTEQKQERKERRKRERHEKTHTFVAVHVEKFDLDPLESFI